MGDVTQVARETYKRDAELVVLYLDCGHVGWIRRELSGGQLEIPDHAPCEACSAATSVLCWEVRGVTSKPRFQRRLVALPSAGATPTCSSALAAVSTRSQPPL